MKQQQINETTGGVPDDLGNTFRIEVRKCTATAFYWCKLYLNFISSDTATT